MIDQFMEQAPVIGLLFFFVIFMGIALWAYHPRNRVTLEGHAQIPLRESRDGE